MTIGEHAPTQAGEPMYTIILHQPWASLIVMLIVIGYQNRRNPVLDRLANAKELRITRDTVRKYAYAEQPPTKKLSAQERAKLKALRKSATVAN